MYLAPPLPARETGFQSCTPYMTDVKRFWSVLPSNRQLSQHSNMSTVNLLIFWSIIFSTSFFQEETRTVVQHHTFKTVVGLSQNKNTKHVWSDHEQHCWQTHWMQGYGSPSSQTASLPRDNYSWSPKGGRSESESDCKRTLSYWYLYM